VGVIVGVNGWVKVGVLGGEVLVGLGATVVMITIGDGVWLKVEVIFGGVLVGLGATVVKITVGEVVRVGNPGAMVV
jgi:hypothetical protein